MLFRVGGVQWLKLRKLVSMDMTVDEPGTNANAGFRRCGRKLKARLRRLDWTLF